MKPPTPPEVQVEIAALRALVPTGVFARKTARHIADAINELEHPYDQTGFEWEELDGAEQDTRLQVQAWLDGGTADKPSEGWGSLVEPKKV